jgi:probable dihydroxyacetone kinase regulator
MSEHTKEALGMSLKKILETKPVDKITIKDLTNDCGVNRQTFYYHFRDIYDLIEWMYLTRAKEAIGAHKTYDTWQEGMLDMCNHMLESKSFVLKTYHSRVQAYLIPLLINLSYNLMYGVVNEVSKGYKIQEKDKKFIADFYKFGFAGLIYTWVDDGMVQDPHEMVQELERLVKGNFLEAVHRYADAEKGHQ